MKLVKKISILSIVVSMAFSLAGCETFGVDNGTWKNLTPAEKKVAMKSYYKQQAAQQAHQAEVDKINAENAPMNGLVSALSGAISKHDKHCITDDFGQTTCGYHCYVDRFGSGHCAQ